MLDKGAREADLDFSNEHKNPNYYSSPKLLLRFETNFVCGIKPMSASYLDPPPARGAGGQIIPKSGVSFTSLSRNSRAECPECDTGTSGTRLDVNFCSAWRLHLVKRGLRGVLLFWQHKNVFFRTTGPIRTRFDMRHQGNGSSSGCASCLDLPPKMGLRYKSPPNTAFYPKIL